MQLKTLIIYACFCCICINDIYGQADCILGKTIFTRQGQLDSFLILYPTCTKADTVLIRGKDIINLHALTNLHTVYRISINGTKIQTLAGLDNLRRCHSIEISNNKDLINLSILKSLSYVDWVSVVANDNLESYNGLSGDSLNHITISGNHKTEDLKGLASKYCASLLVLNSPSIISFSGHNLENLGTLLIAYNDNITSLSSLDNLDRLKHLEIWNNASLSGCSTGFICQKLEEPDFTLINIYSNDTGCNSVTEIKKGCISGALSTSNDAVKISPNPCSDVIYVEGLPETETYYTIHNVAMQVVQTGYTTGIVNTNELGIGFYVLKLYNSHNHEVRHNFKIIRM